MKGAPEFVIQRCTKVRLNNGRVVSMDEKFRETFLEKLETYANNAYRCLALAYVDTPKKNLDYENNDDFEQIEVIFILYLKKKKNSYLPPPPPKCICIVLYIFFLFFIKKVSPYL